MNDLASVSPSRVAMKSVNRSGEGCRSGERDKAGTCGASSKKNETGTCRVWQTRCKRPALIRFVPFSYFWTCWNVMPSAVAQRRLAHLQHHSAHAHATADMLVYGIG